MLARSELPDLVFEATSTSAHRANAARYQDAGIQAVDLTPAAIGPLVCPPVNLGFHIGAPNFNMITCGGQATIPIVSAVSSVVPVQYAEMVVSIASRSAGPGTRASIDEFTVTTSRAIETVGGAGRGKAILVLSPDEPPMIMRATVYCAIPAGCHDAIAASIAGMVQRVQDYVPVHAPRRPAVRPPPRQLARACARRRVPAGPRPRRLPAAVRRQPGHHHRLISPGR